MTHDNNQPGSRRTRDDARHVPVTTAGDVLAGVVDLAGGSVADSIDDLENQDLQH